jgi:hypothetical protein
VAVKENKRGLTHDQYADMLEILKGLSVTERKTLADPDFITEHEADGIVSARRAKESRGRGTPLDKVFAELGTPRCSPRA